MKNVLTTFSEVIRAVHDHVVDTGHQDIVVGDEHRELLYGYFCRDCRHHWLAPSSTVLLIEGKYHDFKLQAGFDQRMAFVRYLVKEGLGAKTVYRPTSWERVIKA